MEFGLIAAWALIALLAGAAAMLVWHLATRRARRLRPRAPFKTMRERWLGL